MALVNLPEIEYVSQEVTETLNNMVTVVEALTGRTLYPADPLRLFLLSQAALIVQQRVLINKVAKENHLRYAREGVLDHIGALVETERLKSTAATTTIRFTLSAAQLSNVTIPAGTRVSTQSEPKRYFATSQTATIAAGAINVDVLSVCTEEGSIGNGYLAGQINQIVDPIAFVSTTTNITTSSGGSNTEDDDAFRERIHTAPEKFSVAGPEGAYEYWAKSANPSIVDVSVSSPSPCAVLIVPLLEGGVVPSQNILEAVNAICNNKKIRPLTDQVTVSAPTTVSYNISLTYWVNRERNSELNVIQPAVTKAISEFVIWQKSRLGRSVNPSELIRRIMDAGAYRVTVISPVYTAVGQTAVAIANTVTANYGGLTDD
ncbi:baseplate assembly protein [Paenibacillus sp. NRS-1760]|uniref:baseplate assembly protein n=1 Tax=Paenibacillus sp. NRS-1760 TaxID=3233902 RepID=UPI003D29443B